jgi:general secretion pathway protein G
VPRRQNRAPGRASRGGMTVMELLVAIAMVAVLAAMGTAAYHRYIERARIHQATMEIGGMGAQISQYAQDNGWQYPDTLADVGLDGRLDPWGQPYRYINIANADKVKARKDKWLKPVNSDFDLYSIGPDGDSSLSLNAKASRDDVVRARDGRFIGIAEDFDP